MDPTNKINEIRMDLGMVFQRFHLFPHMKVIDNIMLAPIQVRKWPEDKARKKALELLDKVGLADKANALPDSFIRWPGTTCCDCSCTCDGAEDHAVR